MSKPEIIFIPPKPTVKSWWYYEGWLNRLKRRKTFYFQPLDDTPGFAYQTTRKGLTVRPFKPPK